MPGAAAGATLGEGVQATAQAERGLTNEPLYHGEPILAVAAIDEATAAEAIEAIDIEFEPLPFVVDPIESLRPERRRTRARRATSGCGRRRRRRRLARRGPDAAGARGDRRGSAAARRHRPPDSRRGRTAAARGGASRGAPPRRRRGTGRRGTSRWRGRRRGSRARRTWRARRARRAAAPQIAVWKWTDEDFAKRRRRPDAARQGHRRVGVRQRRGRRSRKPTSSLDETFMTQSTGHQPLETRTAMAYWQNGKLLPARLDAEHGADGRLGRALDRHHAGQGRASSASTPAAASAARFRAPSRWRFRRCSRRKPTRR